MKEHVSPGALRGLPSSDRVAYIVKQAWSLQSPVTALGDSQASYFPKSMPRLYGNLPIPPKSFLQRIPVPAPAIGKGKGRAVAGEEITIFPRNIRFQSKDFMADLSDVHEKYDVILAYGFFLCFSEENAEIRYSVDYPSQNGSIYITSRLACCPSSQRSTLHSLRKGF